MTRLAWLVVATAACGSVNKVKIDAAPPADASPDAPPDPLDGAKSGTRLKLKWAAYPDGTKQFLVWHDSQLSADCYPGSFASDPTKTYCMPQATSLTYSDLNCTQKISVEYTGGCGSQPHYAFTTEY